LPRLTARGVLGAKELPLMRALVEVVVHGRPVDLPLDAFFHSKGERRDARGQRRKEGPSLVS
jgi:hypothetical protein